MENKFNITKLEKEYNIIKETIENSIAKERLKNLIGEMAENDLRNLYNILVKNKSAPTAEEIVEEIKNEK